MGTAMWRAPHEIKQSDNPSGRSAVLKRQRLYINIDHVATVRQARRGDEPDPVAAALLCERAGADGITAHLREDRRHIQDGDIERLATEVRTVLNLEMACTDEMLAIAMRLQPHQVTLVPERRQERAEGGPRCCLAGDEELLRIPGGEQAVAERGERPNPAKRGPGAHAHQ